VTIYVSGRGHGFTALSRPVIAVWVANVVTGMIVPMRVPMFIDAIPITVSIMVSIVAVAAREPHCRDHHQSGGGRFIASHSYSFKHICRTPTSP
jgi:hypothetical protein